ncbi:winged helix-turn-helix transcriptional regulator [Limosilactobacillus reuteri]|uniref:winged helix-turn-helix transcriptional regulator n=1 Tax=Limosilactobacillus reuteri TaxID=1598 RepID=UPI001E4D40D0|nr:winged helix-turn-helix transcriptional regulator [Limosilactobacillus reuteri]MCC4342519.1 winged helix-turn-helix transcriptional regulator [Limosilactobacillus reuteri]
MKFKDKWEITGALTSQIDELLYKRRIKNKVCRFSELQKRMPNYSRRMLSLQLSELEKDNIVEKKLYPVIPPKTEYKLTRFGQTLTPLIIEMEKWGRIYNTINLE